MPVHCGGDTDQARVHVNLPGITLVEGVNLPESTNPPKLDRSRFHCTSTLRILSVSTKSNNTTKQTQSGGRKKVVGPGPGRPTRSQARLRNLELLDQALNLFSENGFERTTVDDIAAALGMAKRTIYSQYGDKKSLFKAALQRAIDEWIIPVEVLRSAETDDLEETLVRIGRMLIENVLSDAGLRLIRITNAEAYRMPEIGAFTNEQGTRRTLEYLSDLFLRRINHEKGHVIDANKAALAFLNLVVGTPANFTVWGVGFDKKSIARHTRYCVRLFLYGLLAE